MGTKLKNALLFAASEAGPEGREPLTEFRILAFGEQPSHHGPVVLQREDAEEIVRLSLEANAGRDGRVDIDYAHLSQTDAPAPEAHISAGSCLLEVRDDGIWAVDIRYTARAAEFIRAEEFNSFSPVMVREKDTNRITEILQLALTNIPALHGAGLLAASVNGFNRRGGLMDAEGGDWDKDAADGRLRQHFGGDPAGEGFDLSGYRSCFVFYDGEAPENISSYKGLVCDVEGGEVMISRPAVEALAGVMQGARGGIDVSAEDMDKGRRVVSRYYAMWDAVAPWDREEGMEMDENQQGAEGDADKVQASAPEGGVEVETADDAKEVIPTFYMVPRVERFAIVNGYAEQMTSARQALAGMLGDDAHFYLEDMDGSSVQICVYSEGPTLLDPNGGGERVYEIPYTVDEGGVFSFGAPVELVKRYVPKTDATEAVAMSAQVERLQGTVDTLQEELTTLTDTKTFSAALLKVEAWKEAAALVPDLQQQQREQAEKTFETERARILASARKAGKWTAKREARMDRHAERAHKLGEDPVQEMVEFWSAVGAVIYQPPKGVGEAQTPAKDQQQEPEGVPLTTLGKADQDAIGYAASIFSKKTPEQLAKGVLELRQRQARFRGDA